MKERTWTLDEVRELVATGKRKGLKQKEIAKLIGVRHTSLSRWTGALVSFNPIASVRMGLTMAEQKINRLPDKADA